jgi:hypothetical protein
MKMKVLNQLQANSSQRPYLKNTQQKKELAECLRW